MTKAQFNNYINNFEFSELFRIQGWDNFTAEHTIEVQNTIYTLTSIAQKRNFPILQIITEKSAVPDLNTRKQLEKKIRPLYFDHLLVIINKEKSWQYWQLPLREDGKIQKLVSFSWRKGQDVEGLFQKFRNIVFELKEEDIITLADVKERVNTISANSEKVTKKFYNEFITQHKAFLGFIKGIDDAIPDTENNKKQWYASLMLNRLMFCYFIQKKGFLDGNIHYLREKLHECNAHLGKNNFYGFYRSFLLELFHNELGKPQEKRKKNTSPVSFGVIPYLNGGLFDIHELESAFPKIAIKDDAFERIFAFFDEWNWHLDNRITASGKDINPDVIGYIFEKYINQKEMGAYYTKEDITDYIGKNTIIPFLLDKVKSWHPAPFESGGGFWQYVQDSADEYIYDSVKKGGENVSSIDEVTIPENIRRGIDTQKPNLLERREDWNTVTPDDVGLPTEIWRETIARLERYFALREKITKGALQEINGLITYNLNIRKLIQDYLEQTQDKQFIRNFYKALTEITVLDPTCGSGAFLFAALNILEPLYEACINRMDEWYKADPQKNTDFEQRLAPLLSGGLPDADRHPNLSYYIFKTIILNNLYGVDLMKEAVEIAKLRLFLKLVAEVDPSSRKKNLGLEPLPDIDFNIRSGNTLVGFATEQQLEEVVKSTEGDLLYKEKLNELKSACASAALSYKHFQTIQSEMGFNSDAHKESKKSLAVELKTLDETLNRYLADTYGLGATTQWKSKKEKESAYQTWKESHQPFHWLAEFYGIISKGGFDVVIGNPPYVEYSKVKSTYSIKEYETEGCGNLYAFVMERAISLLQKRGKFGMIVPIASISTSGMKKLQDLYSKENNIQWHSNYATRPGKLFYGVDMNLTITIIHLNSLNNDNYITTYNRWYDGEKNRPFIFDLIEYRNINKASNYINKLPKISKKIETELYTKMYNFDMTIDSFFSGEKNIYYHSGGRYWRKAIKNKLSSHYKGIPIDKKYESLILCLLNSQLFYWYWISNSNCMDVVSREVNKLPVFDLSIVDINETNDLAEKLLKNYFDNSLERDRQGERINTTEINFDVKKSKPIIDEIDKVLADHYGFTEEELDFIINYDIKYRMGSELSEE